MIMPTFTCARRTLLHRLVSHQKHYYRSIHPLSSLKHSFGSKAGNDEKEEPACYTASSSLSSTPQLFIDASLRGVGQVIFLNSPIAGGALLTGLAIGDPYLAGLATLGTVSANGVAQLISKSDKDAYTNGLYGYNGCLVGCATSVFLAPSNIVMGLLTTTIAGATTPFVVHAIKPVMGSVPQWTLAFNGVTLSTLVLFRQLNLLPMNDAAPSLTHAHDAMLMVNASLQGLSQIFVVQSPVSGAVLLGGIAYYSPGLAAHAFMGSCIGGLTGAVLMASTDAPAILSEIDMGLWGYNSALTSMGVGVFYVHSPATVALSASGAAATATVFALMKSNMPLDYLPCLTLPFCLSMTACYLLNTVSDKLKLASNPHSPEKNE